MTSLGPGTVLGFERFSANGNSLKPEEIDTYLLSRVVIQLDDPSKWACTQLTPNPYFTREEISELKEST